MIVLIVLGNRRGMPGQATLATVTGHTVGAPDSYTPRRCAAEIASEAVLAASAIALVDR